MVESICEAFQSTAKRLVDHDTHVLSRADWLVELGPAAGAGGGTVIAQGRVRDIAENPASMIGPYLSPEGRVKVRKAADPAHLFDLGEIRMSTGPIHTVRPLEVRIPKGRLSVVTGVSGSGKTTMVLESLVPGLEAMVSGQRLPAHVRGVRAEGIRRVKLIDATPIGVNVRSTVATYANVHDELRKVYARTADAKEKGYKAGDFS